MTIHKLCQQPKGGGILTTTDKLEEGKFWLLPKQGGGVRQILTITDRGKGVMHIPRVHTLTICNKGRSFNHWQSVAKEKGVVQNNPSILMVPYITPLLKGLDWLVFVSKEPVRTLHTLVPRQTSLCYIRTFLRRTQKYIYIKPKKWSKSGCWFHLVWLGIKTKQLPFVLIISVKCPFCELHCVYIVCMLSNINRHKITE